MSSSSLELLLINVIIAPNLSQIEHKNEIHAFITKDPIENRSVPLTKCEKL